MNHTTQVTRSPCAADALQAYFREECREFDREWYAREVANGRARMGEYWNWVVDQIEAGRESVDDVIRTAMATVQINVELIREELEVASDCDVAGLYKVAFGKDMSGMPRARLAAVALDIFYATRPVRWLDDFEIFAVDGAGNRIEAEQGHQRGTFADFGTVENVGSPYEPCLWMPMLYIETEARSEPAERGWARVRLVPALIERLRALRQICVANGLTSVEAQVAADQWSGTAQPRLDCQTVHVTGESFWFAAATQDESKGVKTQPVRLATFFELLATGRDHDVDPSFGWRLGDLYADRKRARPGIKQRHAGAPPAIDGAGIPRASVAGR